MGAWTSGNPENVEGWRRDRRTLLQEPDKPRRNLLGLASQSFPQRIHCRRRQSLHWLQGPWRLRLRTHHLSGLLPARILHARRKLRPSTPPNRPKSGVWPATKGAGVGTSGDTWGAVGQMEEGSLFFELSAPLIYPYFNSTAMNCRSVEAQRVPLLSGNTWYLSNTKRDMKSWSLPILYPSHYHHPIMIGKECNFGIYLGKVVKDVRFCGIYGQYYGLDHLLAYISWGKMSKLFNLS